MLKNFTARCSSHATFRSHLRSYVPIGESASPLLRALQGQSKRSPYVLRRFLCSDPADGSDPVDAAGAEAKRVESGEEAADPKSASAIVPNLVRPEDSLTATVWPCNIPKPRGRSPIEQSKRTSCFSRPLSFSRGYAWNCFGHDTMDNAAAKIGPSVVTIDLSGIEGAGTIIEEDGMILTCAHFFRSLLKNPCSSTAKSLVEVTLQDGRIFEGKLLYIYPRPDIAILKINCETPLPPAKIGNLDKLQAGHLVMAVGHPRDLRNTYTHCVLGCFRRTNDLGRADPPNIYIRTDCHLHPGNSGGPLVNHEGEVLGVIMSQQDAVAGWAVPIDCAMELVDRFKKSKSYR